MPILGDAGGGVGQVSQLLWDSFEDAWPDQTVLVALLRNSHPQPARSDKLRFGRAIASRQVLGNTRWLFFSHLGLARAQRFVPPPLRVPYGVFLHGIECWAPLAPADLRILRQASVRVANSAHTARRVMAANPGVGGVVVCPLALPKSMASIGSQGASRQQSRTVLVVGRMAAGERYKGHEQLIDAWPQVLAAVPDAELVIAGGGDDLKRLQAKAQTGTAAGRIRFTGFVSRSTLDALYRDASVFVLPSRGEGFGLVYLEAMAHQLPCIGSIHDAASEIIVDGVTGLLVDSDASTALVEAVVRLLQNEPMRRAFGEAGRVRLHQQFTFDRFKHQIVDLLTASLESQRQPAAVASSL